MRNLSTTALASINAQHTGEVWLPRLLITHPNLAEPIRVIRDNQNHTIAGEVWAAFDFDIDLPDSVSDEQPRVRLRIQNIDRLVVSTLRALPANRPVNVQVDVVLASAPGVAEIGPLNFTLTQVVYGANEAICDLAFEDLLNLRFGEDFTPAEFPGAFA